MPSSEISPEGHGHDVQRQAQLLGCRASGAAGSFLMYCVWLFGKTEEEEVRDGDNTFLAYFHSE